MSDRLGLVPYVLYVLVLLAFVSSLFVVPFLSSNSETSELGKGAFILYRPMCHQLPSRSLFVFGEQMPVCSRDFGVYFGMLAGALAFTLLYGARGAKLLPLWIFIGAMVPIGIDGGAQLVSGYLLLPVIGTYESTNPVRVATGLFMGFVMSFYALPLLNGAWVGLRKDMQRMGKKN